MGNELILNLIFQLLVAIGVFVILVYVGKYIIPKSRLLARFKASRFSNPLEYFPSEGIMSLKQSFLSCDDTCFHHYYFISYV